MNPTLAGVALAVTAGAVIAASAREARAASIGLALALGLGPFIADPLPAASLLGARVVSGVLAAYLLWAVSPADDDPGLGASIGWPAQVLLAAGAVIAAMAIDGGPGAPLRPADGITIEPLGMLTPSAITLGAGLAAVAVGLGPALLAGASRRTAIGFLLVLQGLLLVRAGLAGPPGDLEQLGQDGLVLSLAAAGALVASLEHRVGRHPAVAPEAVPDDR